MDDYATPISLMSTSLGRSPTRCRRSRPRAACAFSGACAPVRQASTNSPIRSGWSPRRFRISCACCVIWASWSAVAGVVAWSTTCTMTTSPICSRRRSRMSSMSSSGSLVAPRNPAAVERPRESLGKNGPGRPRPWSRSRVRPRRSRALAWARGPVDQALARRAPGCRRVSCAARHHRPGAGRDLRGHEQRCAAGRPHPQRG